MNNIMTASNLLDLKGGKMKKGYPLFVLILIRLIQKRITRANLKWWFGDAILDEALSISDL